MIEYTVCDIWMNESLPPCSPPGSSCDVHPVWVQLGLLCGIKAASECKLTGVISLRHLNFSNFVHFLFSRFLPHVYFSSSFLRVTEEKPSSPSSSVSHAGCDVTWPGGHGTDLISAPTWRDFTLSAQTNLQRRVSSQVDFKGRTSSRWLRDMQSDGRGAFWECKYKTKSPHAEVVVTAEGNGAATAWKCKLKNVGSASHCVLNNLIFMFSSL